MKESDQHTHYNKNSIEFTIPNTTQLIDELIEEIKRIPKDLRVEDIHKLIQSKISIALMYIQEFNEENLRSIPIYRARPVTFQKVNENDPQEFSYPPILNSIKIGRANLPEQQVFYASADPHTPFIEIEQKIKPNETTVYLSKWRVCECKERVLMRTHFLGIETIGYDDYASIMAERLNEVAMQQFQNMPEGIRDRFEYLQKKYAELFRAHGEEFYHLTSAIANDTLYTSKTQGANIHCMTYPSVAKSNRAINFVFRKDFVDSYFNLQYVDKVIVRGVSNEKIDVTPIARGLPSNSGIDWIPFKMKIVDIKWENTSLYTQTQRRKIHMNENITTCCRVHSKSIQDFVGDLKPHEQRLMSAIKVIPDELHEGQNSIETPMELIIELHGKVFGTDDISHDKILTKLSIPITCKVGYFKD